MTTYQAALNVLREERLAVVEVRRTIMADEALRRDDPRHHSDLLTQTMAEAAQLSRAITLLERVQDGDLVEVETLADLPPIKPRSEPARRQTALIRPTPSLGGRA